MKALDEHWQKEKSAGRRSATSRRSARRATIAEARAERAGDLDTVARIRNNDLLVLQRQLQGGAARSCRVAAAC